MTATSLITMRETLEASLVVGIILAYLHRTRNTQHIGYVWGGVAGGVVLSILLAIGFSVFAGGLTGRAEELYEGITMLIAAGLLTWMILWMMQQGKYMRRQIEGEVATHIENNRRLGIFFLAFTATAREGAETVIFLQAAILHAKAGAHLIGFLLGLGAALVFAYCLFKGFSRMPLKKFFAISSALLVLFAAGLIAHGVHELQEAGVLPALIDHVWNINPPVITEGVYPLLHDKGVVGEFLKSIFGYNGDPSLLEVLAYLAYVAGIAGLWRWQNKKTVSV